MSALMLSLSQYFQDQIYLSGLPSPGYAEVLGASAPRDWDVRKGPFMSGAWLAYTGDNLAKFTVRLHLWGPPDLFPEWIAFSKLLEKPPSGLSPAALSSFALSIDHPLLNSSPVNISSVVVEDASQWTQDDLGEWTMDIKFIQFRAPKPAGGKPDKTIPSIAAKNAEQAAGIQGGGDPADLQIQRLMAQMSGGLAP